MKTIKVIFIFLIVLFYLFMNYAYLFLEFFIDKELDNGTSTSALARDVTKNASCTLDLYELAETTDEDTHHRVICDNKIKDIHFVINLFKTEIEKNKFLVENTKRKIYFQKNFGSYYNPKHDRNLTRGIPDFYNPCFKKGKYFVICEDVNWNIHTGIPQFTGEPYYYEFKGTKILSGRFLDNSIYYCFAKGCAFIYSSIFFTEPNFV